LLEGEPATPFPFKESNMSYEKKKFTQIMIQLDRAFEKGQPFLIVVNDNDANHTSIVAGDHTEIPELAIAALRVAHAEAVERGEDLPSLPDFITNLGGDADGTEHGPH
jgi:hypothetical protein